MSHLRLPTVSPGPGAGGRGRLRPVSSYFKFWLLWMLTGSPVTAALLLLAFWVVADWNTLGFSRRLLRFFRDLSRQSKLERLLAVNPHDRKARGELGEILVSQRRFDRAIDVVRPALEQDQDDVHALYVMGRACLGSGRAEQGELFLNSVVEAAKPGSLRPQALLEMGRHRLARGDAAGAIEILRRFLELLPSSVEGRYLLSRALAGKGDQVGAAAERERAWQEYKTALPYQRRAERLWAWRARPSRPATYLALLLALALVAGYAARNIDLRQLRSSAAEQQSYLDD